MTLLTQTTDRKARVSLPQSFAESTVIIEQISETELRIRKTQNAEDEARFAEESTAPLSDRDRDLFLSLLDSPPPANAALRKIVARHKRDHG